METAASIELFVEILDRYVYYFDQQNEAVCLSLYVSLLDILDIVLTLTFSTGDYEIPEWSY